MARKVPSWKRQGQMRVNFDSLKWVIWIAGLAVAADMKIKIDSIEVKVTKDPCVCSQYGDDYGQKRSNFHGPRRLENLVPQPFRTQRTSKSPIPYLKRVGYSGVSRTKIDRKSHPVNLHDQGYSQTSYGNSWVRSENPGGAGHARYHRESFEYLTEDYFLGSHAFEGRWIGNEDPFNAGQGCGEKAWTSEGETKADQDESGFETSTGPSEERWCFGKGYVIPWIRFAFPRGESRQRFKGQEKKTEHNQSLRGLGGVKLISLKEEDILRFLRFSVTESAAATFTQNEYQTNLSLERGMLAAIYTFEIEIPPSSIETPAASGTETLSVQITRESKTALVNFNDSDVLIKVVAQASRGAAIGTDAGPVVMFLTNPQRFDYRPPILFAGESVFVGIQSTNAAAQTIRGRIGYSLISVPEKMYFRVANSLLQ